MYQNRSCQHSSGACYADSGHHLFLLRILYVFFVRSIILMTFSAASKTDRDLQRLRDGSYSLMLGQIDFNYLSKKSQESPC